MRSSRIQTLFLSGGRLAPNTESEALKALIQGSQSIGASIQMIQMIPPHVPQSPGFSNQGSDIVAKLPRQTIQPSFKPGNYNESKFAPQGYPLS